ncbi:MAG TPA: ATP-binding protein, partial [Kofleriaceae bacterium]|nr:ATP-binding protein [Kofleriaceae bacterium]
MTTELRPDELCRRCDPQTIRFETTADERAPLDLLGQDRAVEAAHFAFVMRHPGYNLFALGPDGVGKRTAIHDLLEREAAGQPTPDDWCLVYDFREPRRPRALRLPPGIGIRLRGEMEHAVAELRAALPAVFASEEYRTRKQQLGHDLQLRQEAAFHLLQERARALRIFVERTETGVAIAPMRDGAPIDGEQFEQLPEAEQLLLRTALEHAGAALSDMFARFREWAREHTEAVHALDRDVTAAATRRVLDALRAGHAELPQVTAYLDEVETDVVDDVTRFLPRPADDPPEVLRRVLQHERDERLRRYEVNVMVDHAATRGAPIVVEDNPTLANLIGSVEHVAELGALVTDLTLIRPGALHRANGGYLLLDAARLLQQPLSWPALKRALRSRE